VASKPEAEAGQLQEKVTMVCFGFYVITRPNPLNLIGWYHVKLNFMLRTLNSRLTEAGYKY
jgi:hypothetical protein